MNDHDRDIESFTGLPDNKWIYRNFCYLAMFLPFYKKKKSIIAKEHIFKYLDCQESVVLYIKKSQVLLQCFW